MMIELQKLSKADAAQNISDLIALQKPQNLIPLKKTGMQGAKFSRNEAYLPYTAVTGKLKQRRRSGFFSGIRPACGRQM